MGYLSNLNNEIVIDAILTKYGREKLASGVQLGITKFALSDDEVDYILYDSTNPYGSDYYDIAIRKLPVLEPVPNSSTTLRYRLFTSSDSTSSPYRVTVFPQEVFSTGIYLPSTSYNITPTFFPAPSDIKAIWYKFEVQPWTAGIYNYITIEGGIDSNMYYSNDLALAKQELDNKIALAGTGKTDDKRSNPKPNYVVGHFMKFSTKASLPPARTSVAITITGYGPGVSSRPASLVVIIDKNATTETTVS